MNDCLNCDEYECYECWLIGESDEAIQHRVDAHAAYIESEYKKIFGEA